MDYLKSARLGEKIAKWAAPQSYEIDNESGEANEGHRSCKRARKRAPIRALSCSCSSDVARL